MATDILGAFSLDKRFFSIIESAPEPSAEQSEWLGVTGQIISNTFAQEGYPPSEETEEKMQMEWTEYQSPDTPPDAQSPVEDGHLEKKGEVDPTLQELEEWLGKQGFAAETFSDPPPSSEPASTGTHVSKPSSGNPCNSATYSSDIEPHDSALFIHDDSERLLIHDSSGKLTVDDSGQAIFDGKPVKILSMTSSAQAERKRRGLLPDGKTLIDHNGHHLKPQSRNPRARQERELRRTIRQAQSNLSSAVERIISNTFSGNPCNSATYSSDIEPHDSAPRIVDDSGRLIVDDSGQAFFDGEPVKILSQTSSAQAGRKRKGLLPDGKTLIDHNGYLLKPLSLKPKTVRGRVLRRVGRQEQVKSCSEAVQSVLKNFKKEGLISPFRTIS